MPLAQVSFRTQIALKLRFRLRFLCSDLIAYGGLGPSPPCLSNSAHPETANDSVHCKLRCAIIVNHVAPSAQRRRHERVDHAPKNATHLALDLGPFHCLLPPYPIEDESRRFC